MQVSRVRNGSFAQCAEELVPRKRLEPTSQDPRPGEPGEVEPRPIRTAAYLINQYLFESSRR